jgi:hypothetical protein
MALTNAEKQARWRARRNELAARALSEDDSDSEIVAKLVAAVGPARARAIGKNMGALVRRKIGRSATVR